MKNLIVLLIVLSLFGCSKVIKETSGAVSSMSTTVITNPDNPNYTDYGTYIIYKNVTGNMISEIHFTDNGDTEYAMLHINSTANVYVKWKDINRWYYPAAGEYLIKIMPAITGKVNHKRESGHFIKVEIDGVEVQNIDLGAL
jgi:uncharacterized protein YceK